MSKLNEIIDDLNVNCFIVGFPKCATTSFAQWLELSPLVQVTGPKETNLFTPEYASPENTFYPKRLEDKFDVRVEASTLNIYSKELLRVLDNRDDIKIIIITRPLSEVAESWHKQMTKAGFLDESILVSQILESEDGVGLEDYKAILSHGKWIDMWISRLGHNRVLVIDSQELSEAPEAIAKLLNKFFELNLELPLSVPKSNVYSSPRSKWLYDLVRLPYVKQAWYRIESKVSKLRSLRVYLRENVLLKKSEKNTSISVESYSWLYEQQKLAQELLSRNRDSWRDK